MLWKVLQSCRLISRFLIFYNIIDNLVILPFSSCKRNILHHNPNKKARNATLYESGSNSLFAPSVLRKVVFIPPFAYFPVFGPQAPLCGLFGIVSRYDGSICRRYWSVAERRKKSSTHTFVFTKENAAQHNWQHKSNPPHSGSVCLEPSL